MDTLVDPAPPEAPPAATDPTLAIAQSTGASTGAPDPGAHDAEMARLTEMVVRESAFLDIVSAEVGKVVVGQRYMVERVLIGLLANGHCLIEGVPGLAKTLCVKTLAQTLRASFMRIQFTPDLLPADITGTTIYNMQTGQFTQKRGPLFANLVLADEVNRAPAKVQSALLEAMQERQVTIGDATHPLPDPFLVLATQNPIEQVRMARKVVNSIYIDDRVRDYIVHIVQATRRPRDYGLAELAPLIEIGASPRATLCLATAARALAFIRHRAYVTPDDIKAIALDVMRHRVVVTYEAEAEEVSSDDVVRRVFEYLPVP